MIKTEYINVKLLLSGLLPKLGFDMYLRYLYEIPVFPRSPGEEGEGLGRLNMEGDEIDCPRSIIKQTCFLKVTIDGLVHQKFYSKYCLS